MNSKRLRSSAIYILIVIALGAFLYAVIARQPENAAATVPIARVAELVRNNEVSRIRINDDRLTVTRRGTGELLQARKETDSGLVETLTNLGVTPAQMQRMKGEILEVVAKYAEIDPDNVRFELDRGDRGVSLVSSVPVRRITERTSPAGA